MSALHRYYLALALIAFILLVTGNAFAQTEIKRAQEMAEQDRHEIARDHVTEFCATFKRPSKEFLEFMKQFVEEVPAAKKDAEWLFGIDAFIANRCGDA
jgi:hypothetical protein